MHQERRSSQNDGFAGNKFHVLYVLKYVLKYEMFFIYFIDYMHANDNIIYIGIIYKLSYIIASCRDVLREK